jgi:hypothetical protein
MNMYYDVLYAGLHIHIDVSFVYAGRLHPMDAAGHLLYIFRTDDHSCPQFDDEGRG